MRINIYSEELPDLAEDVKIVSKTDERGHTHYGVRMFFKSAPELHNRPDDDDRSAVTFWIPYEQGVGHRFDKLVELLGMAMNKVAVAGLEIQRSPLPSAR